MDQGTDSLSGTEAKGSKGGEAGHLTLLRGAAVEIPPRALFHVQEEPQDSESALLSDLEFDPPPQSLPLIQKYLLNQSLKPLRALYHLSPTAVFTTLTRHATFEY